nr:hypothetical protein BaRGS_030979 [Batillaria attramentaria]
MGFVLSRQVKDNFVTHAQRVVDYMAEHGGLLEFQARWRRHFVSTMQPRFLPAYWSVDYVPENWEDQMGGGDGDEIIEEKEDEEVGGDVDDEDDSDDGDDDDYEDEMEEEEFA